MSADLPAEKPLPEPHGAGLAAQGTKKEQNSVMLLLTVLGAHMLAGLAMPAQIPKGPVKVFILAGQSNMEGQA